MLVITYNHARWIGRALESVLSQEADFAYEIIVSEDRSTDGTREIVRRFRESHPDRVRLLLSDVNLNDNTVLRRGLEAARGRYVALLDGDDFWTAKDKLRKQVDFLEAHPECSTCFHNVEVLYEDQASPSHPYYQDAPAQTLSSPKPKPVSTLSDIVRGNFIQTCSAVFRTGPTWHLPPWYDDAAVGDWPLHVINATAGNIAYLDETMAAYRVHRDGVWSAGLSQFRTLADVEAIVHIYEAVDRQLGLAFHPEITGEVIGLYERAAYSFHGRGRYRWAMGCARRALAADPRGGWRVVAEHGLSAARRRRMKATHRQRRLTATARTSGEDGDDLTRELHELRSLNQALRVDLSRFEDPWRAAGHLARLLLRPASRHVQSRLGARTDTSDEGSVANFRPHVINPPLALPGDRPRVLHAIANFATGGSAQLVVDLVERLGAEYEQRVIVQESPRPPAYQGVPVDEYAELRSARPLRRLLNQFRPDIVHVHYVADHRRAWSDVNYGWYVHLFDAVERAGSRIVENVNIATEPFRSDAVDRYVFVSEYVRGRYARPGDKATVVYPGSDLARFSWPPGLTRPPSTIGMVYRLQPDKLDEAAIDPIVDVLRRRAEARALVVGGGAHLDAYRRAAERAGVAERVAFPGYVAYGDLVAWYRDMTVFVAPVHTESFGQVSVFAMGMELPVIGYRVGALEEMLGDARLLVPAGQTRRLADLAIDLLDDPERRREIGLRNRRRAEERFSVETMIEAYRAIYQELTADEERPGPPPRGGLRALGRARP